MIQSDTCQQSPDFQSKIPGDLIPSITCVRFSTCQWYIWETVTEIYVEPFI